MPNATLQKLASNASKAYASWQSQMRRDGFTKREQLSADNAKPEDMTTAARALWADYEEEQEKLNHEAANASQQGLFDSGRSEPHRVVVPPASSASKTKAGAKPAPAAEIHYLPGAEPGSSSPADFEQLTVTPERFAEIAALDSVETLAGKKPKVKGLVDLDGRQFVNVGNGRLQIVLCPVLTHEEWKGPVHDTLDTVQGENFGGLTFKHKGTQWCLADPSGRVLVVAGDPLADVQPDASQESGVHAGILDQIRTDPDPGTEPNEVTPAEEDPEELAG